MENNVTTHQNNSVHGDDSLLTVKVDNDTFIDAVMDGVTDHGGAEASNAVKERIQSDKPTTTMRNIRRKVPRRQERGSSIPRAQERGRQVPS